MRTANNFVSELSEGEERNDAAAALSALTGMLDDISGFSIGCTAKSETMDIYSRIDVKKGSELSRKLADPSRTRNTYSGQIPAGSNFAMFSSNLDLMNEWMVSYFDTMIETLKLSPDS
ncbi:MAG: hypothetical protein GWN81_24805, partial [Phycisphaerae bacterium]|nr:hypothetical protein [Phycisphaerae bacterium]